MKPNPNAEFVPGFAEPREQTKKPFNRKELLKIVKALIEHQGKPDKHLSWALNQSLRAGSFELAKKAILARQEEATQKQDIKTAEILAEMSKLLEETDESTLLAISKEEESKIKNILDYLDSERNSVIAYAEGTELTATGTQFFKITELKKAVSSADFKKARKILALVNRKSTLKPILEKIDELISLLPPEELNVDPGTTATAGGGNLYNDSGIITDRKTTNYPGMNLPFNPGKTKKFPDKPFNPNLEEGK